MKRLLVCLVILVCVSFATACSSVQYKSGADPQTHPGHPGHEVH